MCDRTYSPFFLPFFLPFFSPFSLSLYPPRSYGIGIPLYAFLMLYQRRHKLEEERCLTVYGFMYSNFRAKFYFWDACIYARKAAFAMAATLCRPFGSELQCISGIFVLFVCHFMHNRTLPFRRKSLNSSEGHGLLASLMTLFCGLAMSGARRDKS